MIDPDLNFKQLQELVNSSEIEKEPNVIFNPHKPQNTHYSFKADEVKVSGNVYIPAPDKGIEFDFDWLLFTQLDKWKIADTFRPKRGCYVISTYSWLHNIIFHYSNPKPIIDYLKITDGLRGRYLVGSDDMIDILLTRGELSKISLHYARVGDFSDTDNSLVISTSYLTYEKNRRTY